MMVTNFILDKCMLTSNVYIFCSCLLSLSIVIGTVNAGLPKAQHQ